MPLQGRRPIQEAEIEDLQQEIVRLKQRLSRLERRKGSSSLARDFNGLQLQGKYVPITYSRSFIPTKSLRIDDDDDERISDDHISSTYEDEFEEPPRRSSTTPSIEFSFEEFEDLLPNSSSLPIYDEPVYDEYDDDIFSEIFDLDHSAHKDDENKKDTQLELFKHIDHDNDRFNIVETKTVKGCPFIEANLDQLANIKNIQFLDISIESEEKILSCDVCWRMKTKVNYIFYCSRCKFDTGWKFPDRFSQPRPPPYDEERLLMSLKFLLPR